jgi:IS30 family transposase
VGLGHWEGDFIVCRQSRAVLLVLVEHESMTTIIRWLPNRTNELVNKVLAEALSGYVVKTLTLDNDIAFQRWEELEQMIGGEIYFANPYTSTDKALVENTNLWIRQFVPKKKNIAEVSVAEVRVIEEWFNNVPRQCLKGKTAREVYAKESGGGTMITIDSLTAAFVFGGS